MTQVNPTNLFHILKPTISTAGSITPSQEQLAGLIDGDTETSAITLTSGQSLTVTFQLPITTSGTPFNKIFVTSPTIGIEGSIAISVSQNGTSFTTLTTKSSYQGLIGLTEPVPTLSTGESRDYSPVTGKLYRVNSGTNLYIYDPTLNTWSTFALGVTLGSSAFICASTIDPTLYIIQGTGTSNFYKVTLSPALSITPMHPTPTVQPNDSALAVGKLFFDKYRNRVIYQRGAIPTDSAFQKLFYYSVDTDTWTTVATTPPQSSYFTFTHAENIDKIVGVGRLGEVYYADPWLINNWTQKTTNYVPYAPHGTAQLPSRTAAYYSGGKIYIHGGDMLTVPMVFDELDPVTLVSKRFIFESSPFSFNSGNGSNANRHCIMDMPNKRGWTYNYDTTNMLIDMSNPYSYYADLSTVGNIGYNVPYKYVRVAISAACSINQIKVEANPVYTAFTAASTYPYFSYGKTGTELPIVVSNTRNISSVGSKVYINADGLEASRYSEISTDNSTWVGHCTNNDLTNRVCLASNDNYNTTLCFSGCTDFTRDSLNLGVMVSSGTHTCYLRGRYPASVGKNDKEVSISVEHEY